MCPLCSAGKHRKWEVNPHNCFLVACCVKKGLFQPSPEAGVMAGQMSTMAPFIVVPSKGMCCCDENLHPASSQASGILPGQKPTETEKNRKAPLHIKSVFFLLPLRAGQRPGEGWFNKPRQQRRGEPRMQSRGRWGEQPEQAQLETQCGVRSLGRCPVFCTG